MKLKNMFFRLSLPSLGLGSALFIEGISRRQKSKNCLMGDQENCIVTQPISADPSGDK